VGPDIIREPDKLLIVAKEVILGQLESCDSENEDMLLAVLWLLIANSLLGNAWEISDGVIIVKYVDQCICRRMHSYKLAHVVAMVSYYCVSDYSTYCSMLL